MIWLVLVAAVFVIGGVWFVSKSTQTRVAVLAVGLASAAGYWLLGRPDMPDRPLDVRLAEIEARVSTAPETLNEHEVIALAERRVQEHPEDSHGLVLIGQMYESLAGKAQAQGMAAMEAGREDEANRQAATIQQSLDKASNAYNTALRRNPNDLEAIANLADLRFKMTSEIDPFTTQLYETVYKAQPDQFRQGYLAGIGLWGQGKTAEAEAIWADVNARAPEGGPERQMFAALRQMFGIDPATAGPGPIPPTK